MSQPWPPAGVTPYYWDDWTCIIHGDAREVLPELAPGRIDLVLADPPYGINVMRGRRTIGGGPICGVNHYSPLIGDDTPFDPTCLLMFPRLILWGANHYASRLPDASKWLVWDKRVHTASDNHADVELAWTNLPGPARRFFCLWRGCFRGPEERQDRRVHPTQKPMALMRWCIQQAGDNVATILDPFMGSGTTLRAAKDLGRRSIGIEISEEYCAIAASRLRQEVLPLTYREDTP